eukprot:COSAG02_NODE_16552_length_1075_cov_1.157787_1_plen_269_part_10
MCVPAAMTALLLAAGGTTATDPDVMSRAPPRVPPTTPHYSVRCGRLGILPIAQRCIDGHERGGATAVALTAATCSWIAAHVTDMNAVATVRLKQDDAVSTMHRQNRRGRGGDYPGFVATDNPLAGLPALSKPHYSFGRYNLAGNGSGIDNRATLVDYARITSAFPVVPELSETAVRKAVVICQDAIRAGGGNCSLSISWSPYISQTAPSNFPKGSKVPYAVNVTTVLELKILKEFKAYLVNVTRWAADQSRIGKVSVDVGAILLDQEVF